ncbi:hypothetical protein ETI06_12200 [Macrococcoides goetzii]|nr:hypothetical protein [Macrococcus goetzii]TDM46083.1 hypothetical protein ETI06_12200 [Macrococcus goetzii]
MNYNISDTVSFIESIEEKYSLFGLKENDIYIWKISRVSFSNKLNSIVFNTSNMHGNTRKRDIYKFLFKNMLPGRMKASKNEILIIENPRKIKIDGKLIDPYTNHFINTKSDVLFGYTHYKYQEIISNASNKISLNNLEAKVIVEKMIGKTKINDENLLNIFKYIDNDVKEKFNINISTESIVNKSYEHFVATKKIYSRFFKKSKINHLYLICSYGKEGIISAAKENDVYVTELQHGVMGRYHLGYHFEHIKNIPYFPDEAMLFGEFWGEYTKLPVNCKKTITGYNFLSKKAEITKSYKKDNTIVIISQGTIGKELSVILNYTIKSLPQFNFIYKLHPGEFKRWKEEYPKLYEIKELNNIEVIEDSRDLYEIFSESKICIGAYSTAIYESIAFGNIPIILDLPGKEYIENLKDFYNIPEIRNGEQLVEILKEISDKEMDNNKMDYLWKNSI